MEKSPDENVGLVEGMSKESPSVESTNAPANQALIIMKNGEKLVMNMDSVEELDRLMQDLECFPKRWGKFGEHAVLRVSEIASVYFLVGGYGAK